jgi:hypothetical protein
MEPLLKFAMVFILKPYIETAAKQLDYNLMVNER